MYIVVLCMYAHRIGSGQVGPGRPKGTSRRPASQVTPVRRDRASLGRFQRGLNRCMPGGDGATNTPMFALAAHGFPQHSRGQRDGERQRLPASGISRRESMHRLEQRRGSWESLTPLPYASHKAHAGARSFAQRDGGMSQSRAGSVGNGVGVGVGVGEGDGEGDGIGIEQSEARKRYRRETRKHQQ